MRHIASDKTQIITALFMLIACFLRNFNNFIKILRVQQYKARSQIKYEMNEIERIERGEQRWRERRNEMNGFEFLTLDLTDLGMAFSCLFRFLTSRVSGE